MSKYIQCIAGKFLIYCTAWRHHSAPSALDDRQRVGESGVSISGSYVLQKGPAAVAYPSRRQGVCAPLRFISYVLNELKSLTAFLSDTFPMTPWPPSSVPVPNRSGCHWLFSFVLQVSCGFERWSTKAVLWVPTVTERSWLLTGPAKNMSLAVSLRNVHSFLSRRNISLKYC